MERAILVLKPKEDLRLRAGHPWVYDNEIARVEGQPEAGAEVEVRDARGLPVGVAFFNPKSKIRARIYSRAIRPADAVFFKEAIGASLAWRRRFFDPDKQSVRAVFAEADGLPGLMVDSFVEKASGRRFLTVQFLTLGMDARKELVVETLRGLLPSAGIAERSDAPVRAFEGLESVTGTLHGTVPPSILIGENGLAFAVDLLGGQKTGWFLDQRSNRAAAARHAVDPSTEKGRRVLDTFCNAGGFGLACLAAGAESLVAVDSQANAVADFAANAERNGFADRVAAVEANAFDYLRSLERKHERFGLIILDPPAFAKNRASLDGAHRGYKDINMRALKLLEPGGVLVTCSCSHWFDRERFATMLEEAAADAGKRLRIVEERTQDLDHPIVTGYGESRYLKCVIAEAI